MSLKDEKKREYQRDYMRKRRGLTGGSNKAGLTNPKGLTLTVKGKEYRLGDKDVPPIVKALADPVERAKMQKLVLALDRDISGLGGKKENMLDLVMRGIGEYSVTMRQVKNLLTAF